MLTAEERRRQAFAVWIRTGRRLPPRAERALEYKFNPWHDPETGRFTFAGQGRYFGSGRDETQDGAPSDPDEIRMVSDPDKPPIANRAEADAWYAEQMAQHRGEPAWEKAIKERYQLYLDALSPREKTLADLNESARRPVGPPTPIPVPAGPIADRGGGGSFGGGGASGSWDVSSNPGEEPIASEAPGGDVFSEPKPPSMPNRAASGQVGPAPEKEWRRVSRNGYIFELDAQDRMRRVTGELTDNPEQGRSRSAQLAAGGSDRRPTDHGGHYIARRFNGPTDAFNHFAQDANFNRGDYRRLEEEWARDLRKGRRVRVKIVPVYVEDSQRPSALNVWFWVDGVKRSQKFPNEPREVEGAER